MLPKSFNRYWFWVALPVGLAAGYAFSWWAGLLTFWVVSAAPSLLYYVYQRLRRKP